MRSFLNLLTLLLLLLFSLTVAGQGKPVPFTYSVAGDGRIQLKIEGESDRYYLLHVRQDTGGDFTLTTSLTPGRAGRMTITEPAAAYPSAHYRVISYPNAAPADTDGDGVDDLREFGQLPRRSPLNAAAPVDRRDGVTALDSFGTFRELSLTKDRIAWSEFLNGKGYVKFIITDFLTDRPKLYFFNSDRHYLHADFAGVAGIEHLGEQVRKGQVIYHPASVAANGTLGTFAFNYSNGHGDDFGSVRRTYELLAANMPLLTNNLAYYVTTLSEDEYARDSERYRTSRIPLLFEADVFAAVDYLSLNPAEGYGTFRKLADGELPGPRDIVLYDALPNDLPRVAGIMTSVIQTPLSHVNLRAIQSGVPNAFVRDPLAVDSIAALLDRPVYFRVSQGGFELREATSAEVNEWFDALRPTEPQLPPLNLDYTKILPLHEISFWMYDGYGAKCANVATMRHFGFPEGTIPDGFGVPFYFYREFMRHNGLFDAAEVMLADADFRADRAIREERLADFRKRIRDADMPSWMRDALGDMHARFPAGTSVRCRSSTNNEDLPGFNGAGLYTSKTQHPHEGHIDKSIRQVYASLWNLRAYEERDYHRVDHLRAAMGVLCHPNFSDERVNGVGVSQDPLYGTERTFYLNSQVGEELITNPGATSVPEEVLLEQTPGGTSGHILVQRSNLVEEYGRVLGRGHLDTLRDYLAVIHEQFARLYDAAGDPAFAMDIEYKVTRQGQLSIKQARPWVGYAGAQRLPVGATAEGLVLFPNPTVATAYVSLRGLRLHEIVVTDVLGRRLYRAVTDPLAEVEELPAGEWPVGVYVVTGLDGAGEVKGVGRVVRR